MPQGPGGAREKGDLSLASPLFFLILFYVELSTILIKYAFKISIQFWSRRDNSVVPLA